MTASGVMGREITKEARAGLCEGLAWPQPLVRGFGLHGRSGPGQSLTLRVRRGSVSHSQHFVQIARRVGFAGR